MELHHVQVCCPPGGEEAARRFYGEGLAMTEVDKPDALAGRGGAWFRWYDADGEIGAEIHVGVEPEFTPARRAHPALHLDNLDEVADRLTALGFEVDWSQRDTFTGHRRCHTVDGHGNRVELLSRV